MIGQTTITTPTGRGVVITNSDGDIAFGDVDIDTPGTGGIYGSGNSGDITFGDVTISNPGFFGIDFENANTGQAVFGSTVISGLTGGTVGLDLTDGGTTTSANVICGSLSISGTGGTGIDMTGSTNSGNVGTTGMGTMTGLDLGVDLTNAAITGVFQFGDGSNLDGDGVASSIDATTPIVVTGMSSGTYNFNDVDLIGDTSGLITSQTVYYADATGTGIGDTINDPASLADAEASGADVIVLVNSNGTTADTLTVTGDGTFTLDDDQDLMSFAASDMISLTGGAPANLLLYGVSTDISNPYSGFAPTLTNATAVADTVTLGNGNIVSGVSLTNDGGTGGAAISDSSITSVTISATTISGVDDTGIDLDSVGGSITIADTTVSNAGGTGLLVDGGSQNMTLGIDLSASADTGLLIGNRTGGTITYSGMIDETDGVDRGIDINSNTNSSFLFQQSVDIVSDGSKEGGSSAIRAVRCCLPGGSRFRVIKAMRSTQAVSNSTSPGRRTRWPRRRRRVLSSIPSARRAVSPWHRCRAGGLGSGSTTISAFTWTDCQVPAD
ncbi:hypothetical protein [Breoghania sp.]|uniref:beta strand repeat-containing protein n=1 Tax=Breoghania sp. TaxID=2065378 RepID=UPI002633C55D|nr:hypothetical protein [Breoghania sp.]MDJ0929605.1 hypothetical protein [Breoghania sp.]